MPYNTSWYDMSLYFLCVSTNVGFVNVATMLLVDDRTEIIASALRKVADLNPQWKPKYVMSDFSLAQISATESVFPGVLLSNIYFQSLVQLLLSIRCKVGQNIVVALLLNLSTISFA